MKLYQPSLKSSHVGFVSFDQRNFLFPPPTLDFLFARDCHMDVVRFFEMDNAINTISGGESRNAMLLVLERSPQEIIGHAYVKAARLAREDIDKIAAHHASKADSSLRSE